jgi:hypothetical protein
LLSGAAAGVVYLTALAKHDEALDHCASDCENDNAKSLQNDAKGRGRLAAILAVAGGVAFSAGALLFFSAPSSEGPGLSLVVSPTVGSTEAGLHVRGIW